MNNYAAIIADHLASLFTKNLAERATAMGAELHQGVFQLRAFGAAGQITREGIRLDNQAESGPRGIIIALYALHAGNEPCIAEPFKSFKELPGSMPYAGAFANRTEQALIPQVERILLIRPKLSALFGGGVPQTTAGDFGFVLYPLPKVALCYLFYRADEDFPAAVTTLFSYNAERFLPTDGLADLGEYTSKAILAAA